MAGVKSEKQFFSMFLILISLFILIFFTKGIYSEVVLNGETIDAKDIELKEKQAESASLGKKKEVLERASEGENNKNSKYLRLIEEGKVSSIESDIISDFYGFTDRETEFGAIEISSINFSEKSKTEFGFDEVKINVTARVPNEAMMIKLLNHIIENEKYQFFINSFSVPEDTSGGFSITIPVQMIFKELKELKKVSSVVVVDGESEEENSEEK